jgi:hypothetical protein
MFSYRDVDDKFFSTKEISIDFYAVWTYTHTHSSLTYSIRRDVSERAREKEKLRMKLFISLRNHKWMLIWLLGSWYRNSTTKDSFNEMTQKRILSEKKACCYWPRQKFCFLFSHFQEYCVVPVILNIIISLTPLAHF